MPKRISACEKRRREQHLKRVDLPEYFVWWEDLTRQDVTAFKKCLKSATKEEHLQKFLKDNPTFLVQTLGRWHGRWAIPKKELGNKYVTDFLIASKSSIGYEWHAVELEHPNAKMFTEAGNPTKELTHAIRQIQNWRNWLERNRDTAIRPVEEDGLGLIDISADITGLILLGRNTTNKDTTKTLRRRMMHENRIKIHTYDWLLDEAEWRVYMNEHPMRKNKYQ